MQLSPRQFEVVACAARGLQDKEIADELGISLGTAKSHIEHAIYRLGLRSRVDLATWYLSYIMVTKFKKHFHEKPGELRAKLLAA